MNNLDPYTLQWAIDSLEAFAERMESVLEATEECLVLPGFHETYHKLQGKAEGARFMAMHFRKELSND